MLTIPLSVVASPGVRVTIAESVKYDLGKVSEWCDLWGMKLNERLSLQACTIDPQSPPLIICGQC